MYGQGSGKGTIASSVVKEFGVTQVSTGDILRSHVERKTPVGLQVADMLKAGGTAPSGSATLTTGADNDRNCSQRGSLAACEG